MTARKKGEKVAGQTRYGPYTRKSDGRRVMSVRNSDGSSTSTTYGRHKAEKRSGKELSKDKHVDHKDNNKKNDSSKNLRVTSAKANIAKGNRNRRKKR